MGGCGCTPWPTSTDGADVNDVISQGLLAFLRDTPTPIEYNHMASCQDDCLHTQRGKINGKVEARSVFCLDACLVHAHTRGWGTRGEVATMSI